MSGNAPARRPDWLKVRLRTDANYRRVRSMVSELRLNTVCTEARCPNIYECWNAGTATFMILGDVCTRRCGFCSVQSGLPAPGVDPLEPRHVAEAVVPHLVRDNRNHLLHAVPLDQGVEEHDPARTPEPGEKCVGLGRSLGTVDLKDLRQGKLAFLRHVADRRF